jgi:malonyl CoA-acyl carrier protein transacylase
MATNSLWQRFQQYYLHYDDIGFSLDISRMRFPDGFLEEMEPKVEKAFAAMRDLEAGGIANPDEKRMVGHYWLRNPQLAPNDELRADIKAQMQSRVSWTESVQLMIDNGINTFVEAGSGEVLLGLVKRIDPAPNRFTLGSPQDFMALETDS